MVPSVAGQVVEKPKKPQKRKWNASYCGYIYKILRQSHKDVEITKGAMAVMNSLCIDLFNDISSEASNIMHFTRKVTISQNELKTASHLILPGNLAKNASVEGTKAVTRYLANRKPMKKKNQH